MVSGTKRLLALFAVIFGAMVLPTWLMAAVTQIELFFPLAMRGQVKDLGLVLSFYAMVISFTLMGLDFYLSDPNARGIITWSSPDRSGLFTRQIIRPVVTRMGARFIRQHIRSRLDTLVSLYRARVAAGTLTAEDKASLQEITEEATKLRDTLPSEWQHVDVLRYPTIVVGLLGLLGFMHGQTMPPALSISIGCLLLAPYVLARRMKHIALEWEIPVDTPVSSEDGFRMASIYSLESRLFRSIGCSSIPKPARVDVILQLFAGIIATIGCLVFAFQMAHLSSKVGLVFWCALDAATFWFFVYKPLQELRARAARYSFQRASIPKLELFTTRVRPDNAKKFVFLGSFSVVLIECGIAMYKEGITFALQLPLIFEEEFRVVMQTLSHSPHPPIRMREMHVTAQQEHLAVSLFLVWFGVTILLAVLDFICEIVIYPTLRSPNLRDYLNDMIGDCRSVIAFLRKSLPRPKWN